MDELSQTRDSPHVLPHDDGEHFWFIHWCWDYLGERGARRDGMTETMLPIAPLEGWVYDPEANTISPSILCGRCGTHGFWTRGVWHPC